MEKIKYSCKDSSEEADLLEVWRVIKNYKYSITFITLLFILGASIYLYYAPRVFQTDSTIEVVQKGKGINGNDILETALGGNLNSGSLETEISLIKSRTTVLKAMDSIDMVTHLFGVDKFYKKSEIYKDRPFKITLNRGDGFRFKIIPIDGNSFKLEIPQGLYKEPLYSKTHKYGELIKNSNFTIKVDKVGDKNLTKYREYLYYEDKPIYYAEHLKNRLMVNPVSQKADILSISFSDNIALRAKEFVDKIVDVYIDENIKRKTSEATQVLEFINEQLKIVKKSLEKSALELEKFKESQQTVDISYNIQQLSNMLADYEAKGAVVDMQLKILKRIYKKILKGGDLASISLIGLDVDHKSITELIRKLQESIAKRRELKKIYTSAHPSVKMLTDEIYTLKSMIKSSIENMITVLEAKRSYIYKNIEKYRAKLSKIPKKQRSFLSLERKFKLNEKFYSYLLEKKTEAEIKKAATVSQIRVVDRALMPQKPIKPKSTLTLIISAVLGLIFGVVVALIRSFLDSTIRGVEELEKLTDIPILGTIPQFKVGKRGELVILNQPKSKPAEAFRSLRTNLQFMLKDSNSSVIAITSTVSGEGKSLISANLGTAFSFINKRVVVINFDLRKPALHKIFQVPNKMGLSEYLREKAELEDIVRYTKIEKLHIITSGELPENPSELISSNRTKELIETLRSYYDIIILDTPPVGLVVDAKLLLEHCDSTLYILRANYSKKEFIKVAEDLKNIHNIKNLGLVLNGVKLSGSEYEYESYRY
jgi:capsular exopolysaccharide synthesis family protein